MTAFLSLFFFSPPFNYLSATLKENYWHKTFGKVNQEFLHRFILFGIKLGFKAFEWKSQEALRNWIHDTLYILLELCHTWHKSTQNCWITSYYFFVFEFCRERLLPAPLLLLPLLLHHHYYRHYHHYYRYYYHYHHYYWHHMLLLMGKNWMAASFLVFSSLFSNFLDYTITILCWISTWPNLDVRVFCYHSNEFLTSFFFIIISESSKGMLRYKYRKTKIIYKN